MFQRKFGFLLLALTLLALSGCYKSMSETSAKVRAVTDETYFDLGEVSRVTINTSKKIKFDGRSWNWSELMASVCHDSLEDRGIVVGKITPSMMMHHNESKLAGRRNIFMMTWTPKNNQISLVIMMVDKKDQTVHFSRVKRQFLDVKTHYEDDEAFYEGLKTELRPVVDSLWDEAFANINKAGVTDI